MKKIGMMLICMMLLGAMSALAIGVMTHGVSPRDAEKDTLDIFDIAYNGMLNVGTGTQMYLAGMGDGPLAAPTWTVSQAPAGSGAAILNTADMDPNTQIGVFTPDLAGTYQVDFTDGAETASVIINAGTYVGIEDGNCDMCHKAIHDEWEQTGHHDLLEVKLNSPGYYGANCIPCHTTGFDDNAANNGFDEHPWEFPTKRTPATFDSLAALYPAAMKLARIQCESCHGPGSAHNGDVTDNKVESTMFADVCAWCHDAGTHHVYPEQWDVSVHASGNHLYAQGGTRDRGSCMPCHNGTGFVDWLEGNEQTETAMVPITCQTCHDPHSAKWAHQVRTLAPVELGDGTIVEDGGMGQLCMNCHKGRRNAAEYTGPNFSYSGHYGPHHGPQTDMLLGTNVPTFGKVLPMSPHYEAVENTCVTCHMAEGHTDDAGNVLLSGSHSFNMRTPDGVPNLKVCEECHGEVGEDFGEKMFFADGVADHDGDGADEGLAEEIHGLLHDLSMMLPPLDSAKIDISGKYIFTETEAKAAFNYLFVEEDRSNGAHNPAFAVGLLKVSKQAVANGALAGGIVEILDVPNDQGKQVRIIWNAMADDGIAVDPIAKYIVKRFDSDSTDSWTTVGEATADGSGRYALVVPTVYDSTADAFTMTQLKVVAVSRSGQATESAAGEGYSVDNLVPGAPQGLVAGLVADEVVLSWEESEDADFNYFAVYRGTEAGFDALEPVATLTGTEFTDGEAVRGVHNYYRVVSVDFSGNQSLASDEAVVDLTVSGVGEDGLTNMPDQFALEQNFPNPFNPTTMIKYQLPEDAQVSISIYSLLGDEVKSLVNRKQNAGYYTLHWDATNNSGSRVPTGVYIYRIQAGSFSESRKMILMK